MLCGPLCFDLGLDRVLLLLTILLFVSCSSQENWQRAHQGTIDLRGADLSKEAIPLDGQWTLIWNGRDTLIPSNPPVGFPCSTTGKHSPCKRAGPL